jgi:23S rRNA (guanosine2251-2'-O)-methyltransferase
VREAIRVHGPNLHEVLIEERPGVRAAALERFAFDQGIGALRRVPRSYLDQLSGSTLHQGVAAWADPLTLVDAEQLWERKDLLAIALDGIVDPQNFGAVVRSAVALSKTPIVWPENASAPLTPATFRASAGAIEHATLCRVTSLPSALRDAAARGIHVLGLAPEADHALHEVDLTGPTVLVIGSEHEGMGKSVRRTCTQLVRLVAPGAVQSLNASVAAGIALYAATIQRVKSSG